MYKALTHSSRHNSHTVSQSTWQRARRRRTSSRRSTWLPIPKRATTSRRSGTQRRRPRAARPAPTSTTSSRASQGCRTGTACSTPSRRGTTTPARRFGSRCRGTTARPSATSSLGPTSGTASARRPSSSAGSGSTRAPWGTGRWSDAPSRPALTLRDSRWPRRPGSPRGLLSTSERDKAFVKYIGSGTDKRRACHASCVCKPPRHVFPRVQVTSPYTWAANSVQARQGR